MERAHEQVRGDYSARRRAVPGRTEAVHRAPAQTRSQQGHERGARRGALVITARAAGRVGGMGLGHAFASASRFRAAS